MSRRLEDTLESRYTPEPMTGCWLWLGYIDPRLGYGQCRRNGVTRPAHRVVYELLRGPIQAEDLDHKCRNRACVNPDHLEPCTHRENTRRGNSPMGINARKTHCIRGHEFNAENTGAAYHGGRFCRTCVRLRYLGLLPRAERAA